MTKQLTHEEFCNELANADHQTFKERSVSQGALVGEQLERVGKLSNLIWFNASREEDGMVEEWVRTIRPDHYSMCTLINPYKTFKLATDIPDTLSIIEAAGLDVWFFAPDLTVNPAAIEVIEGGGFYTVHHSEKYTKYVSTHPLLGSACYAEVLFENNKLELELTIDNRSRKTAIDYGIGACSSLLCQSGLDI